MIGPADVEPLCDAWAEVEVETGSHVTCDSLPVDKTSAYRQRGVRATPFGGEGLDFHCGLIIETAAGAWIPHIDAMFGCGSARSKSSWALRQVSLGSRAVNGVATIVWVVTGKQTYDPREHGDVAKSTKPRVSYTTNVVVCRIDKPACAAITRAGRKSLATMLAGVKIVWP